jgi:hypothetical protein
MSQGLCTAYTPAPVKLSELRAKTDQQLQGLVHSKLELGLNFVAHVEVEESAGNPAFAERSFEQADQALAEVQRLLPALNEDQRRGFCPKLNKLQKVLDRLGRNRERPKSATASVSC